MVIVLENVMVRKLVIGLVNVMDSLMDYELDHHLL